MQRFIILALIFITFPVQGDPGFNTDTNADGKIDQWYSLGRNGVITEQKSDNDFDGTVDYLVQYFPDGKPKYEEFDYNSDGKMDTFYYYTKGSLVRQEIDSNFDGKVDIWIYLYKSVYIERYEIDEDFDGKVDKVKNYNKS